MHRLSWLNSAPKS